MAKRVPESEAASEAEVVEAIHALTDPEMVKLKRYARYRAYSVGLAASRGRTWVDLLNGAMTATLEDGERSWRKNAVTFTTHLIGVMRSMADHWRDEPEVPDSTLAREGDDGESVTPLNGAHAPPIDLDARLDAAAVNKEIAELISKNALAMEIYEGLRAEMTRAEIREVLGLTEQEYDTRMRWIRRRVAHLEERL